MPPMVIADSDDDIDERSPSPVPQPRQAIAAIDAPTRLSDHVSQATISTDSAFFQSVFHEQNEAAIATYQQVSARQSGAAMHRQSSPDAIQQPFGLEPSSLFPDHEKSDRDALPISAPQTATEPAAMRATEVRDLWDVPSSPESKSASDAYRVRATRTKGVASVKITRGLRRNLEQLGYESDENTRADTSYEQAGESMGSTRGNKKRKVDSSRGVGDDDGGPITGPKRPPPTISAKADIISSSRGSVLATPRNICEPTLPVGSDSSFLIAPRPLSASQKGEYQNVDELIESSPPLRKVDIPVRGIGSSGSATMINTPRSNLASSHDVGLRARTPESEAICHMPLAQSARRRRNSSPDVIALVSPEQDQTHTDSRSIKTPCVSDARSDGDTGAGENSEITYTKRAADDDESDYALSEKPVKPKKQRGRPRKVPLGESAEKTNLSAPVGGANSASPAAPKKKRGRPKKLQTLAETANASHDPLTTETISHAEKRNAAPALEEPRGQAGMTSEMDARRDAKSQTGSPSKTLDDKLPPPATPQKGSVASPAEAKGVNEDKGSSKMKESSWSKSAVKPLYRVGLSKRLRIAPLLKSLPK
ncbi:hypothetical protein HIM_00069 [Hirsutella minnesotensis 3608]|nr:hypothetical protein HIM_00069 [Hirsutella minnesotensis 3608]